MNLNWCIIVIFMNVTVIIIFIATVIVMMKQVQR